MSVQLIKAAMEAGVMTKTAAWYAFGEKKLGPGESGAVKMLDANEDLCLEIAKAISPDPAPAKPVVSVGDTREASTDVAHIGEVTQVRDSIKPYMAASPEPIKPAALAMGTITRKVEKVTQPYLTEEEAIGLGVLTWCQWIRDPKLYTTVVQQGNKTRRFIIDLPTFSRMKNGNLAIEGKPQREQ
jgi:hypothetical protein